MFYYVYRITNTKEKKHYYGKRSSRIPPHEDIGIKYFSSSKDLLFIEDQKQYPEKYKYKVVSLHRTAKEAVQREVLLHDKFSVHTNPSFYNRAKQTSTGFDTTGITYSAERIEQCRKQSSGRKHTAEAKKRISEANKGNTWNLGRRHTKESIALMAAKAKRGIAHPNAVLVDIFDFTTDALVAERVVLNEWCKSDKSLRSNLSATLKADRSKPKSRHNPWQARGLYAKYSNV